MKDRKYTQSEIETFQWISLYLLIGFIIAWGILMCFSKEAFIIASPFVFGLTGFFIFLQNFFLAHNKKIDKYEELKLQAKAQAEADKEKIKSQIWVNE